jgi:3-hydroxymyristoyl/3-hydroxydecanoyl-(acyl carrier protein) dehydratase
MNALSTQKISMLAEQPASFSMAARDIYPLICVRDPYFAFQRFDVDSEQVTSALVAEHPLADEVGPIAAAEAGRHLAIIGSCAAAMANPTRARHYYLAREAYIERTTAPVPPDVSRLTAHATASMPDKRTARAQCSLFAGDGKLFSLDVNYAVLSEAIFTRFYGKYATEPDNVTPLQRVNPYRSSLPLEIFENDGKRMRGTLGVIRKELCAGHFTRFPCLPVAALMHALSRAAGALFVQRAGLPLKYTVESAEVSAKELAFAGTRLDLEASYMGETARGEKFCVRGISDSGNEIGELIVVLKEQRFQNQA